MHLYLLRHGIAADLSLGIKRDADRPLTKEGWKKMRDEAHGMQKLGIEFDLIFSSPYLRTRQTALAVAEVYEFDADNIISIENLAAGRPFAHPPYRNPEVFTDMGAYEFEKALIVGHMPDLSEMASLLLTGTTTTQFEFKKGSLCLIEVDALPPRHPGVLRWMLTPKQLISLASKH
ncbi:MAG: phosphohistidine phosphatase SixA [Acidobacteria bacterium]|nr:phosphohistidine phosphatase SixA [Acidobacteriota bacterium]